MAKGRKGRSGQAEPEAPNAAAQKSGGPLEKAAAKADRGLRKHLKRLERRLADAARTEARRIRKLERARWRRQRLEAAVDEAKTASSVKPSQAAPKPKAPAAPKAKATAAPKAKATAARKAAAPKAPATKTAIAPATSKGRAVEAYCRREKRRVQMLDPKTVATPKGGSALSGTCPSCGGSLYRLVSRPPR
jgi:hypothetical protein